MSTNVANNENKLNSDPNGEQIVVETQPLSNQTQQHKQKLSSAEELALLGLRPNSAHSDPCLCMCCIFCMEACMVPTGGVPPVPPHKRMVKNAIGLHNWDNDSNDGDNNDDGMEWAVELANHITGTDGGNSGHHFGSHGHDGDCGHDGGDGGGGDGGGGGGGDCGGGE